MNPSLRGDGAGIFNEVESKFAGDEAIFSGLAESSYWDLHWNFPLLTSFKIFVTAGLT